MTGKGTRQMYGHFVARVLETIVDVVSEISGKLTYLPWSTVHSPIFTMFDVEDAMQYELYEP